MEKGKREVIWFSVRPELHDKLRECAVEEGYGTITNMVTQILQEYDRQKFPIYIDTKHRTEGAKMIMFRAFPKLNEKIQQYTEQQGMKVNQFLRNMVYSYFLQKGDDV
jgi:hypothetical protein